MQFHRYAASVLAAIAITGGCAQSGGGDITRATASGPRSVCAAMEITDEDAVVRAPFEIVNGRVFVEARVNGGGPYRFAVDTGASGLGRADASLTRRLSLPVVGTQETGDGVNVASVDVVRMDSFELGAMRRDNMEVITRDYGAPPSVGLSGIIGRDFFADGLLVIDFPTRTLTFSRNAALSADSAGALHYERPFRVPMMIGERQVEGNLDTGAAVTLVFPRGLYDEVAGGPTEAAGQGQLTNTTINADRAIVHGPISLGDISISDVEVRVSDRFPELLIGGHVLQDYRIAIDQRSQVVGICPPQG